MYDRKLNDYDSAAEINKILYDKATSRSTVRDWHTHFKRLDFKTTDFPMPNNQILSGSLTDFAKQALVVYEHDHKPKPTIEDACNRINDLFGENTVTEDFVQVNVGICCLFTFI
jgi:hypothetical protein